MDVIALEAWFKSHKLPPFRLKQVNDWVYRAGVTDFALMSNLPQEHRDQLAKEFSILSFVPGKNQDSKDNQTTKIALKLRDGALIEMVLMRHLTGRKSVCISSQTGCSIGCAFCATGQKIGNGRNLTAEEMVDQVVWARHLLMLENPGSIEPYPNNVVMMGMGEPFVNYDNVMQAIKTIQDRMQIGGRRLTVSTSGVAPRIVDFAKADMQVNLAVSLHAATDKMRDLLVPLNQHYPLAALKLAVLEYMRLVKRKVFFEYVMLDGINDTEEALADLIKWLPHTLSHVNLIPYNEVSGTPFRPSREAQLQYFHDALEKAGVPVTVRHTMGDDVQAACGQLAAGARRR